MTDRHRWVKVREHTAICERCGTGRVHVQANGRWYTQWHRPNGLTVSTQHTPPCEVGPMTVKYLAKYAAAIACAAEEQAKS